MNKRGQRCNVEAQEEVVAAIWNFARDNKAKKHNITAGDGASCNGEAISTALEKIMAAFGYKVAEIQ